ncbi:MAG: hypothetical protein V4670_02870 [Bacteroidota bacterium]
MKKIYTIIECEGRILTLDFKSINNMKLTSFLNNGTGKVTYETHINDIMMYFKSKITLQELVENSSSEKFGFFEFESKTTTLVNKKTVINNINCGELLFCDLPSGMGIHGQEYAEMILNFFNPDFE